MSFSSFCSNSIRGERSRRLAGVSLDWLCGANWLEHLINLLGGKTSRTDCPIVFCPDIVLWFLSANYGWLFITCCLSQSCPSVTSHFGADQSGITSSGDSPLQHSEGVSVDFILASFLLFHNFCLNNQRQIYLLPFGNLRSSFLL